MIFDLYTNNNHVTTEEMEQVSNELLRIKCPEEMNILFSQHRSLMYYPSPKILSLYLNYYISKKDYLGFRDYINSIMNQYFIVKEQEFVEKVFDHAFKMGDRELYFNFFLHLIDYQQYNIGNQFRMAIYFNDSFLNDDVFYQFIYKEFPQYQDVGTEFAKFVYYYNKYVNYKASNNITEQEETLEVKETVESEVKETGESKVKETVESEVKEDNVKEEAPVSKAQKLIDIYERNINKNIETINNLILKETDNKPQIHYNYKMKVFLRSQAGNKHFNKLDKKILDFFDEAMKLNIFDVKEREVEEAKPKEFVLPKKIKVEEVKEVVKEEIKEEVISIQLHVPRRGDAKSRARDDD